VDAQTLSPYRFNVRRPLIDEDNIVTGLGCDGGAIRAGA
jgi:hypothetical protein